MNHLLSTVWRYEFHNTKNDLQDIGHRLIDFYNLKSNHNHIQNMLHSTSKYRKNKVCIGRR